MPPHPEPYGPSPYLRKINAEPMITNARLPSRVYISRGPADPMAMRPQLPLDSPLRVPAAPQHAHIRNVQYHDAPISAGLRGKIKGQAKNDKDNDATLAVTSPKDSGRTSQDIQADSSYEPVSSHTNLPARLLGIIKRETKTTKHDDTSEPAASPKGLPKQVPDENMSQSNALRTKTRVPSNDDTEIAAIQSISPRAPSKRPIAKTKVATESQPAVVRTFSNSELGFCNALNAVSLILSSIQPHPHPQPGQATDSVAHRAGTRLLLQTVSPSAAIMLAIAHNSDLSFSRFSSSVCLNHKYGKPPTS